MRGDRCFFISWARFFFVGVVEHATRFQGAVDQEIN